MRNGISSVIFDTSSSIKSYRKPSVYALFKVMDNMFAYEAENINRYIKNKITAVDKIQNFVNVFEAQLSALNILTGTSALETSIASFDTFLVFL